MTELNAVRDHDTEARHATSMPLPRELTTQSDPTTPSERRRRPAFAPINRAMADTDPACADDPRFRDLLGAEAWGRLPAPVQRRFARPLADGAVRIFRGSVTATSLSLAGRILARAARLVGGPLPDTDGATGPAVVVVSASPSLNGQIWTRTYTRPGRLPQTINSVKRFAGPTGLEEYLGWGLVMRLTVQGECGPCDTTSALVFRSAGYDLLLFRRRIPLPRLLTPGQCTITHRDEGAGRFSFTLSLDHERLGRLVHQVAHFDEASP